MMVDELDEQIRCCENCRFYYTDFGMPCCKKNDITEEHPDVECCAEYEEADYEL